MKNSFVILSVILKEITDILAFVNRNHSRDATVQEKLLSVRKSIDDLDILIEAVDAADTKWRIENNIT